MNKSTERPTTPPTEPKPGTQSPSGNEQPELAAILARGNETGSPRRKLFWWGVIVVMIALGLYFWWGWGRQADVAYVTEPVARGSLVVTATATGTLEPTRTIEVGSELSGTLEDVFVQENDVVEFGELLAVLDTSRLEDAIAKSKASLSSAQAQVLQSDATVAEARATLTRMQEVFKLSGGKVPSESEIEVAEATLKRAMANLSATKAAVMQAEAEVKTNQTNLQKAQIKSPVNGVVLTREVEPGNTVVAAMSTPVLFTIAEDLRQMELRVSVDEADVATVSPGQAVSFTVSAWPGRQFPASIERVGLGSTITDNVVTYKTILRVDNDDLALRPGMTATATITTAERGNVLLVPNAALRYRPSDSADDSTDEPLPSGQSRVWRLKGDQPEAVAVTVGISNGRLTEVLSGDLQVGDAVILGQETPE
ncbi:MAG TPA: efflux RND transporter periplasmic adaptor subunit [Orrella sp.]